MIVAEVVMDLFFKEIRVLNNLNPKEKLSLKNLYAFQSFMIDINNKKLNDYKLWEYFNGFVVLVKKNRI
jgi:hypothetical protein